jgi:hypothetical protein
MLYGAGLVVLLDVEERHKATNSLESEFTLLISVIYIKNSKCVH